MHANDKRLPFEIGWDEGKSVAILSGPGEWVRRETWCPGPMSWRGKPQIEAAFDKRRMEGIREGLSVQ